MTQTLLHIGSPTVTYSGVGNCWLVDTGALVPIAVPGRRLAYEIAAAYVPPAAGSDGLDGIAPRTSSSLAPGSASPMYHADPGASNASLGVEVGASLGGGAPTGNGEAA